MTRTTTTGIVLELVGNPPMDAQNCADAHAVSTGLLALVGDTERAFAELEQQKRALLAILSREAPRSVWLRYQERAGVAQAEIDAMLERYKVAV